MLPTLPMILLHTPQQLGSKILDITSKLNSFPLSGRIVPELGDPTLREKLAYSYRIIYKVEDETITIAAVIHGKRLLESDKINES